MVSVKDENFDYHQFINFKIKYILLGYCKFP